MPGTHPETMAEEHEAEIYLARDNSSTKLRAKYSQKKVN
jgi:hypothetical protein